MPARMDVSIVIPFFDEAATWPRLLEALDASQAQLGGMGKRSEVVITDDGSRDGSWVALRAAAATRPWLRLVRLRRNFGQTAALAAGFRAARGEIIVPMDADLQNDPVDIPRLLAKLDEGYDVVSGWRRARKDHLLSRRVPSRIANWLVGRVARLRLHDYGCTLKAYRRTFLDGVSLYGEMHRFIPVFAHWQGARVTELEVTHHARREGRSKYGLGRTFNVLVDLVTLKFLGDFSTKPLYLFGKVGALLCTAGTIAALVTLYEKYIAREHAWVHRNPLFGVAVFLFMLGVQMVLMGLLAELQVRTYHEGQGKPIYLIAETVNDDQASAERPLSRLDTRS
jgi:glycosyltransferase involved in cell wall biosynthesis